MRRPGKALAAAVSPSFATKRQGIARALAWGVALVGVAVALSACTTRPFQPAPPLYTLWAKPGVDVPGVRSAMLACGFPDAAHVEPKDMTLNDYAGAQRCMIDRGFRYQDRRIVCTDFPRLPACAGLPRGKTFGTDPDVDPSTLASTSSAQTVQPAYTYWTRPGDDIAAVKREMTACGYTELNMPSDVMPLNDVAAAQLCMLDKGFRYGWPSQALLCKSTPSLPACRGKAINVQRCCAPPTPAGQK
nr:hypothetical protein [Pandoraea sp. LA3]